ncbi:MAG: flagellar export protein FliJ [Gemmatimonadetes bacterium]|jgi:flagellar FliJ protein|nr:flagellar export protein FliJ [Gemmatimonadota bacterium]MBP9106328.1 flagellar export protein FliJ [Gemmatimonadaceae bacterium]MBK6843607.1 flagellar export protein FliJ [Gemmatimonadota bacterium]MBK7833299.1 flagellar export protein FliJ [Gemmatimonadota bacterium]MBK8057566.1 flagellar export protein FliJ [Gemmatimonadota bacterium]
MMFNFRLQRLLDLKAKHEQEMARQLANAQSDAQRERDARDDLARVHAAAHSSLASAAGEGVTVGELVSLAQTLTPLQERVTQADERTIAAEHVVDERHQRLNEALQERQVLDRLREKRLDTHRAEENARDLAAMDAIALTRHKTPSGTASRGQDS